MNHDPFVRRNYALNLAEGSLYICSTSFVSAQTLLPALVARLGGSNTEIGVLAVMYSLGIYLPQILSARYVQSLPWKKPAAIRLGFVQRLMILVIGVLILSIGGRAPSIALWLFLAFYSLNQIMIGVTTPAWFDLFTKLTPAELRGRLTGLRIAFGGLGALGAGAALTWILGLFQFPAGYALAFFGAAALQFSSLVFQMRLVEAERSATIERTPALEFIREIPGILRADRGFRMLLGSCALLVGGAMPLGFFTVYGLKHFSASEDVVGEFTMLMVAAQVVGAFISGYVADRFGHKTALVGVGASLICANAVGLLAPTLGWFKTVFPFLGIYAGTEVMTRYNLSADFAPAGRRATYVGLMNTILAPLYLMAIVGGVLGDLFGYPVLFGLALLLSGSGVSMLVVAVPAGRHAVVRKSV